MSFWELKQTRFNLYLYILRTRISLWLCALLREWDIFLHLYFLAKFSLHNRRRQSLWQDRDIFLVSSSILKRNCETLLCLRLLVVSCFRMSFLSSRGMHNRLFTLLCHSCSLIRIYFSFFPRIIPNKTRESQASRVFPPAESASRTIFPGKPIPGPHYKEEASAGVWTSI